MFITPTGTPGGTGFTSLTPVPATWFNYVANNFPRIVDGVGGGYYQLTGANLRFASSNRIVKFNQADPLFPLELRGYVTIGATDEADYATGVGSLTVSVPATFSGAVMYSNGAVVTNVTLDGNGLTTTGNGVGSGVVGTGGSNNGRGGFFTGGATNGIGLEATGTGTGFGGGFIGGSNGAGLVAMGGGGNQPGIRASADGTGAAVDCLVGGVKFSGVQPTSTADPGSNMAHATNQAKVWARITTNGAGGVNVSDGYNVASVSVTTSAIEVTFAHAFATSNFCTVATNGTSNARIVVADDVSATTTSVELVTYDAGGSIVNPQTTAIKTSVAIFGRQ